MKKKEGVSLSKSIDHNFLSSDQLGLVLVGFFPFLSFSFCITIKINRFLVTSPFSKLKAREKTSLLLELLLLLYISSGETQRERERNTRKRVVEKMETEF